MSSENRIGQFLRARRELVRPADVGLSDVRRRRVPGLRREELALLAGVSVDYYVRLEQGREQHPSEHVLDALARAGSRPRCHRAPAGTRSARRPAASRNPPPARQSPHAAATRQVVGDARLRAFERHGRPGAQRAVRHATSRLHRWSQHLAQRVPGSRTADFLVDWEGYAKTRSARCAPMSVPTSTTPSSTSFGELSLKSELLRRLWARHDIHQKTGSVKRFNHPIVGELELDYETFAINAAPGQIGLARS